MKHGLLELRLPMRRVVWADLDHAALEGYASGA